MRPTTLRLVAFVVLALLGAPVALHLVLHDLHHPGVQPASACLNHADPADHEHPVVSSGVQQLRAPSRSVEPVIVNPAPASFTSSSRVERNTVAHGALRLDDDVGLQPLLSTFLI